MNHFFQDRFEKFNTKHLALKRQSNQLSMGRLACFVFLILGVYFLYMTFNYILLFGVLLLGFCFLYLITKHKKCEVQSKFNQYLALINKNEMDVLRFDLDRFETGKEFIDQNHDYTFDLDFFGPHSIFQYLNRTTTKLGKVKLAKLLSNPLNEKGLILERQRALQELSEKIDFLQAFNAEGMFFKESDKQIAYLHTWLQSPSYYLDVGWINIFRFLLPLMFLSSVCLSLIKDESLFLPMLIFLLNLCVVGLKFSSGSVVQSNLSSSFGILKKYMNLIRTLEKQSFESVFLKKIKNTCELSNKAMKSLSKVIFSVDQRLNSIFMIIFNGVFLYDFHVFIYAEKWKEDHKDKIEKLFSDLCELDALNSLANYVFCHPHFVFPVIADSGASPIRIQGLKHPLIRNETCVENNIDIGVNEKLIILTGANMSGKSTLLRSVGVNVMMAMIGVKVSADMFSLPVLKVMTSMRITDDIKTQTSYFYSELKRLKKIVDQLETQQSTFVILDEILKGTNSDDKLSGSISLIKNFVKHNCLGIIATHDLELGKLENDMPELITNKCFESDISNNELTFDYMLKTGIAKNKNATFLMNQMKII